MKKLETQILITINGGATSRRQFKNANGCQVTVSDIYDDKNGNGEFDDNESGTETTTIQC